MVIAKSLASAGVSQELVSVLEQIHRDVIDVRERVIRIEAQDHSEEIRDLKNLLGQEIEKRNRLELSVQRIKTELTPILIAISLFAAAFFDFVFSKI